LIFRKFSVFSCVDFRGAGWPWSNASVDVAEME
jgi:hypothetical protein